MKKVYGLWTGTGWLRSSCGVMVQSHSPNGTRAYLADESFDSAGLEVKEIGEDGLPVAAQEDTYHDDDSARLNWLDEDTSRLEDVRGRMNNENVSIREAIDFLAES